MTSKVPKIITFVPFLLVTLMCGQLCAAPQVTGKAVAAGPAGRAIAGRLREAVRIPTVPEQASAEEGKQVFSNFIAWLARRYRGLHYYSQRTLIDDSNVILKWEGKNPKLQPILLSANFDVAPVPKELEPLWDYPPFGGTIVADQVYGRGTCQGKSDVVCICEAAEQLIRMRFQPERTIYLSFTCDGDFDGESGRALVAQYLREQGVELAWIVDAGSSSAVSYTQASVIPPMAVVKRESEQDMVELPAISSSSFVMRAASSGPFEALSNQCYQIGPRFEAPQQLHDCERSNEHTSIQRLEQLTNVYIQLLHSCKG